MRLGESVSKMCKQASNSNNGEKYEKECVYWKKGINLLWRELVGLLMFVVQLQKISSRSFVVSVLYNLSALPDFKHWMVENLASLCLEGDIGRGFFLIHCIFSFSSAPVGSTTTMFILLPLQLNHRKCSLCPVQASRCPQTSPESTTARLARTSKWSRS